MNKKVIIFPVIIFFFFILFIGGCSSEEDREITLRFAGGGVGVEEKVTKQQIKKFEGKYPNINIEYQVVPNSTSQRHDIFVTHLSAGDSTIDVYAVDVIWPAEFGAAKWVIPLDKYISPDRKKKFFKSSLQSCIYKGKLYAIPWFVTTGLLYYRKDLLNKEGFSPPTNWEELVKQSKVLQKKYKIDGFLWQGAQYEGLICDFLEFVWSNGGKVINDKGKAVVNSPEARGALRFMKKTIHKYEISPQGTVTYKEEGTRQIFQDGKAAFLRNWPYVWTLVQSNQSEVKNKVGVTSIPKGPKGNRGISCIGGWNLAISRYSEHPDAAYKFIKFMTAPNQQIERGIEAGQSPSLVTVYHNTELLKANPFYKDLVEAVKNSRARPQTPFYSDISEVLQIYTSKALTEQLTVKEALDRAEDEIKKILKDG